MLERDDLYHRLNYLVPHANFNFWPDDGRKKEWDMDNCECFIIDGWCVSWSKNNAKSCPSVEEIKAVNQSDIDANIEAQRKAARNERYSKDLSLVALYEVEKRLNANLKFSDYLDGLEKVNLVV